MGKALQGKKCNKEGALDIQRKKSLETYYKTCAFPKPTDKKKTSIVEKFQIDVCDKHHAELHKNWTDWAKEENKRLKRQFQLGWMRKQMLDGAEVELALDAWMAMIDRNYVEELMPE